MKQVIKDIQELPKSDAFTAIFMIIVSFTLAAFILWISLVSAASN